MRQARPRQEAFLADLARAAIEGTVFVVLVVAFFALVVVAGAATGALP